MARDIETIALFNNAYVVCMYLIDYMQAGERFINARSKITPMEPILHSTHSHGSWYVALPTRVQSFCRVFRMGITRWIGKLGP